MNSTIQTTIWQYDNGSSIRSRTVYALTAKNSQLVNLLNTFSYAYSKDIWKDLLIGYDGLAVEAEKISLSRGAEILGYDLIKMRAIVSSWV